MTTKPWGALPVSRVVTIMKSSSEAENIGKESPQMMAKAAELFIKQLAAESYKLSNSGKKLDYKHVAEVVNREERYEFLRDIMPKKITYGEYKRMMATKQKGDGGGKKEEAAAAVAEDSDSETTD